jgi:hypothetical protein
MGVVTCRPVLTYIYENYILILGTGIKPTLEMSEYKEYSSHLLNSP